jgi:hypothetical protein
MMIILIYGSLCLKVEELTFGNWTGWMDAGRLPFGIQQPEQCAF